MNTRIKWLSLSALITPLAVYAVVSTDDGLNTSGNNTVADGESSAAIGSGNEALNNSLAVGENNIVGGQPYYEGLNSIAVGVGNVAHKNSIAVGTSNTVASYSDSCAIGLANTVYGGASVAIGSGNNLYSHETANNIAIGRGNVTAYFEDNIVIGLNNTSYGKSWILGEGNHNHHDTGTVMLGTPTVKVRHTARQLQRH